MTEDEIKCKQDFYWETPNNERIRTIKGRLGEKDMIILVTLPKKDHAISMACWAYILRLKGLVEDRNYIWFPKKIYKNPEGSKKLIRLAKNSIIQRDKDLIDILISEKIPGYAEIRDQYAQTYLPGIDRLMAYDDFA